jgi:hypothetical protein
MSSPPKGLSFEELLANPLPTSALEIHRQLPNQFLCPAIEKEKLPHPWLQLSLILCPATTVKLVSQPLLTGHLRLLFVPKLIP